MNYNGNTQFTYSFQFLIYFFIVFHTIAFSYYTILDSVQPYPWVYYARYYTALSLSILYVLGSKQPYPWVYYAR